MLFGHRCQGGAKEEFMEFGELEILLIQVITGAVRLIRINKGLLRSAFLQLKLTKSSNSHRFWVEGLEQFADGTTHGIGGDLQCIIGTDTLWSHGEIIGHLYLQQTGKCPIDAKHIEGKGMLVKVRKDKGLIYYSYSNVGEFII